MASKVRSASLVGLDAVPIEVECDAGMGMPAFTIVGLPDASVQESRERIRAAFKNSGIMFPRGRVTVNLAPADIKKEGPSYDVPIALAILCAEKDFAVKYGKRAEALLASSVVLGELSLDGRVRGVAGVLAVAMMMKACGLTECFVPVVNADEACLVEGLTVYPVASLAQLVAHIQGKELIVPYIAVEKEVAYEDDSRYDFAYIHGQDHVKRALEIAAAGGHNILMSGAPGSGKTLLARSLASVLPTLTTEETLEVTKIYSVAGLLPSGVSRMVRRPFRSAHHSASTAALIGGGSVPRPGEISLAHRGVLFLDEFPEFSRGVLEALRQPLEDGAVVVSRSAGTVKFPAQCMLVAAQNPCPCGFFGDTSRACTCTSGQIAGYQKKVSGPLLDRIDLWVEVPRVEVLELTGRAMGETSRVVRARVEAARVRQQVRFCDLALIVNAEMSSHMVKEYCVLRDDAEALLSRAVSQLGLSARGYFRTLKIARTIADLAGEEGISMAHVAEALQYRPSMSSSLT